MNDRPRLFFRRGRAALLVAAALLGSPSFAAPGHALAEGDVAPDFLGRSLDGHRVKLATFRGKVVVISFWATWCPPCREELPVLENIQKAGKGTIQVVAINTERSAVFRRAAKVLSGYTLLLSDDEDESGIRAYGGKGLPFLVVIGKDGRIVSMRSGYGAGELDDLASELNQALRVTPDNPTGT